MRAWRTYLARLLLGSPSLWATAVQLRPSLRQSATASAFCCAVNRRLVLVGLVIDGQSEGHGVTPIDLSTKPGQPHRAKSSTGHRVPLMWHCAQVLALWFGAVLCVA